MNDTLLPNKMTKSYLLESDPFLKTSSKTSPFALNSDDSVFRGSSAWNGNLHNTAIPGELISSDRPTVKPLAMHNVPSNVPPIAYINGNSVRPIRCRHYSQQQTVFHNTSNNNNDNNSSNNSEKLNSGIKVAAAGDMNRYAQSNGVNEFGGNTGAGDRDVAKSASPDAKNGLSLAAKSLADAKAKVQSVMDHNKSEQPGSRQQSSPKQRARTPSRQSPSSIRDYVTNNESPVICTNFSILAIQD